MIGIDRNLKACKDEAKEKVILL